MAATVEGTLVIDVRGLSMAYGPKRVLTEIDFTLAKGEVLALLGPNGAGKTTTIEILEGFRAPSGGTVSVLGVDPINASEEWRGRVGVVLQSWRDHGRWRVRELLSQFGSYYTPFSDERRPRPYPVDELLEMVGLTELADSKVMSLSGGQRRRLDVAIGIVGRPEILFLDEPTVGFDPVARREFHDLVHRLSDLEGTSILLTTHDLSEAEKLADRIIILNNGQIAANGSADQLSREVAGTAEVRWMSDGQRHVHATTDGTAFVRELLAQQEDVHDLEVRRATLEDTYLAMVASHSGAHVAPALEEGNAK